MMKKPNKITAVVVSDAELPDALRGRAGNHAADAHNTKWFALISSHFFCLAPAQSASQAFPLSTATKLELLRQGGYVFGHSDDC